jgi:hypothetical protein
MDEGQARIERPRTEWRRTLTAIVSAAIVSAVVWGIVVFFDVR